MMRSVSSLVEQSAIRVEDGNHGEYRPRPQEFVDDGVKFIRAADMTSGVVDFVHAQSINEIAFARIRKGVGASGDVILSHKGTVGKVAVVPEGSPAFVCSPQTTIWRSLDYDVVDPRFLAYSLRSPQFQRGLQAIGSESDMAPYVSLGVQKSMSVPLPDIKVQRKVGDLLGALDEKVAANRSVAERSDYLVRSMYRTLQLSKMTLGDIALNVRESVGFEGIAADETYIGLDHVDRRSLWLERHGVGADVTSSKSRFAAGDVLFGKLRPYFHKVALASSQGVCSTDILVLRARDEVDIALVAASASSDAVVAAAVQASNGTKMPRAKWTDIAGCRVPDPNSNEARTFCCTVEAIANRAMQANEENRQLAATRDELLPLLMSGKITVKDAEKTVEEVLRHVRTHR